MNGGDAVPPNFGRPIFPGGFLYRRHLAGPAFPAGHFLWIALPARIGDKRRGFSNGSSNLMNVFFEFHKLVQELQNRHVKYAVIGGVAMAFHAYARFTKDIDILTQTSELDLIEEILNKEGYKKSGEPWNFKNKLQLHRFWKTADGEEMIIDILVSQSDEHSRIIDDALEAFSETTGTVRVAKKEDLIWLKSQRNSPIDQADIETLNNESDEKH